MAQSRRKKRRNANKKDIRLPLLLILAAALVLFVLVMPKETTVRAMNVSASGQVSTHAGLVLSEVMTDNLSALPDENGRFGDWVEIENTLDEPMNLKGVGISDRNDRIKFLFPDVTLSAGGRVVVFCDGINQDDAHGIFHAKFKMSSLGETLYLFDASGVSIDSVTVPTLNGNESYIRVPAAAGDGEDDASPSALWEKTDSYSPGFENTQEGHARYLAAYAVTPGTLMINEVVPTPRSGLRDEDDDLSDWIELYNAGEKDIPLGNFALSDDETKPVKWTFPQDAVIPAGGYYIVFCSGKDKVEETTRYPHTNFSINSEEETLVLSTQLGELVDRVVVTGVGRDMSYGRDPQTLNWRVNTLPTPGAPNDQSGANRADQFLRALNHSGVYISEVMSSANRIKAFEDLGPGDYVEIYNSSAQVQDLSGWGLSDNIGWPHKWTFPAGTSISPGEYKVILLDKYSGDGVNLSQLRGSFGLKRAGGEILTLADATGRVLDRMYLPEIPTDISYGRTLGANGFFYYDAPTPGQANGSGFSGFSQKPVFDTPSGLYRGEITVQLAAESGAQIRYTTDGSIPTLDNSLPYSGPIEITDSVVIRARAFQGGLQPSDTVTASYIMNTYHTLDVISLVCEPHELWDPQTGLLSEEQDHSARSKNPNDAEIIKQKENGEPDLPFRTPVYRSYGKDDRPGYIEFFNIETGECYISQGIKMDLMGAYSLDMPQKSFKIRAQAALGEKYFNYPLFPDRPYTQYKSFTLRNSGNDNVWTRVNDGMQTRLIDKYLDSPILTLAWRPVIVYLNGQYWGHYNLRERKDRFSIAQHEGLDLEQDKEIYENATILRGSFAADQGSNKEYKAMVNKFKTLNPNQNPEDLQYIYDHIDVDSYIEWLAIKMYFGDSDPGNIMYYKLPGGKWKCLMFDLDYGLYNSEFNSPWSYLKEKGMGTAHINNVIFRKMLESDEIRDKFLTRLGFILKTLTTDVMIQELQECTSMIEIELPMHWARWAGHPDTRIINKESPSTSDGYMRYWRSRVSRSVNVLSKRPHFIWEYIQKQFSLTNDQMLHYFGPQPENRGT
ncbi:MAG: lamin tail domain-containing protein [Clostridiales bacterium]|nr:lamin tail domain-containing protein [Clostridiales bacterium]